MTRLAWMAHPFGGKTENLLRAQRWLLWLWRTFTRVDFIADWIPRCMVLSDVTDRARSLDCSLQVIQRLSDFWMVGGAISPGMKVEQQHAIITMCQVIDLTPLGLEPPPIGSTSWWGMLPEETQQHLRFLLNDEMVRKIEERL